MYRKEFVVLMKSFDCRLMLFLFVYVRRKLFSLIEDFVSVKVSRI